MKKLILLLNDYPSTGKSTLARCFSHYLSRFGVPHQLKTLVEETDQEDEHQLDASRLLGQTLAGKGELRFSGVNQLDDLIAANGKAWVRGTLDLVAD